MRTVFAYIMHWSVIAAGRFKFLRPVIRKGNDIIASLAYKTYLKHGEAGWDKFWIPAMTKFGQIRGPYIKKVMNVDVNDPAQIGRFHDFEDPIFGVTGHWETSEDGHPMRVETGCQLCEHIMKITKGKGCPAFCEKVVYALEMGTGTAMNDTYYVEIDGLLTGGDDACRFIHKLKNANISESSEI